MRALPSDSTTRDRARLGDREVGAADPDSRAQEQLAQMARARRRRARAGRRTGRPGRRAACRGRGRGSGCGSGGSRAPGCATACRRRAGRSAGRGRSPRRGSRAARSASLRPISSVVSDFALTTSVVPLPAIRSPTMRLASAPSRAQCTAPAGRRHRRLELDQVAVEVAHRLGLDRPPGLAQRLPVGQLGDRRGRLARIVCVTCERLRRSCSSASAARAASGNGCAGAAHAGAPAAARASTSARWIGRGPAPAGAAHRRCASGTSCRPPRSTRRPSRGSPAPCRRHRQRGVGVLDRERAAEAAALVGARQRAQLKAAHRAQQPQRPVAEPQRAQGVAGRVVGDRVRELGADVVTPSRSTRSSVSSQARGRISAPPG